MTTAEQTAPYPELPLRLIAGVVNRLLGLDPELAEQLAPLQGQVLEVQLKGLDLSVYVHFEGTRISLSRQAPRETVHVSVRGTPLALLGMVRKENRQQALASREVEIIGDLGLAQQIQGLLAELHLDWEELLSHYTGDILAHQLGNAARGLSVWGRQTRQTLEQDISEYLRYETGLLPSGQEVHAFLDEVDTLSADSERLQVRLRHLSARRK